MLSTLFWMALVGCGPKAVTIESLPDAPASVILAGFRYEVPPLMVLTMEAEKPGVSRFDWLDKATGCGGWSLFERNGDLGAHDAFMRTEWDLAEQRWVAGGLRYRKEDTSLPVEGADVRLVRYDITRNGEDLGPFLFADTNFPAHTLSVVFGVDCPQGPLIEPQIERILRLIQSRKAL